MLSALCRDGCRDGSVYRSYRSCSFCMGSACKEPMSSPPPSILPGHASLTLRAPPSPLGSVRAFGAEAEDSPSNAISTAAGVGAEGCTHHTNSAVLKLQQMIQRNKKGNPKLRHGMRRRSCLWGVLRMSFRYRSTLCCRLFGRVEVSATWGGGGGIGDFLLFPAEVNLPRRQC